MKLSLYLVDDRFGFWRKLNKDNKAEGKIDFRTVSQDCGVELEHIREYYKFNDSMRDGLLSQVRKDVLAKICPCLITDAQFGFEIADPRHGGSKLAQQFRDAAGDKSRCVVYSSDPLLHDSSDPNVLALLSSEPAEQFREDMQIALRFLAYGEGSSTAEESLIAIVDLLSPFALSVDNMIRLEAQGKLEAAIGEVRGFASALGTLTVPDHPALCWASPDPDKLLPAHFDGLAADAPRILMLPPGGLWWDNLASLLAGHKSKDQRTALFALWEALTGRTRDTVAGVLETNSKQLSLECNFLLRIAERIPKVREYDRRIRSFRHSTLKGGVLDRLWTAVGPDKLDAGSLKSAIASLTEPDLGHSYALTVMQGKSTDSKSPSVAETMVDLVNKLKFEGLVDFSDNRKKSLIGEIQANSSEAIEQLERLTQLSAQAPTARGEIAINLHQNLEYLWGLSADLIPPGGARLWSIFTIPKAIADLR